MKNIVAGILAHVDAGKTTLSEQLLYLSGTIRNAGRVDNGDTFLDTDPLERARGITIFSKQAVLQYGELQLTLLDTPGHVAFSAEMERTLCVLDYAILLISAPEGVQAHTKTLWRLLERYHIPTFLFINKMDMTAADKDRVLREVKETLSERCIDFSQMRPEAESSGQFSNELAEELSLCDEKLLSAYLETGKIAVDTLRQAIKNRALMPCFFGAALRQTGVDRLLQALAFLTEETEYGREFGAIVYKISRDEKNTRLTHMKITGGVLKTKEILSEYDEKIHQIRCYSGEKFELVQQVQAGGICAVTGLNVSKAGDVLGSGGKKRIPFSEPVMTYQLCFREQIDQVQAFHKIEELCEELPELHMEYDQTTDSIRVKMMGEVQTEVLKSLLRERYGYETTLQSGRIVYKETIADTVYGVGHFEPLRHYAEVHLLLQPGERGSGIVVASDVKDEELSKNWQKQIVDCLKNTVPVGVLTGSEVTDLKITLKAGKAHLKHTEGGDFRQAAKRALRQGLMQADNLLLEPYYDFEVTVPSEMTGRIMSDLELRRACLELPQSDGINTVLAGYAPVSLLQEYSGLLRASTKGQGKFVCRLRGYEVCQTPQEVIDSLGYDAEADVTHTPDSVFCAHGAGYIVPWYEAASYMHVPLKTETDREGQPRVEYPLSGSFPGKKNRKETEKDAYKADRELEEIFIRTYGNRQFETEKKRSAMLAKKKKPALAETKEYVYRPVKRKERYLLVDGYNVIHAWQELRELAAINMAAARDRLLDIMANYQGYEQVRLIVVFDAYKVKGFAGEEARYHNIHVVFTKEAQTADSYIERFAHDNAKKYDIAVATSDGLEQIIITGQGCRLFSARELEEEIARVNECIREKIENPGITSNHRPE